jgi:DNA-binding NarL/FixJ family response regulator
MKTLLTRIALIEPDISLNRSFQTALKLQPNLDCQVSVAKADDLLSMAPRIRPPQIIVYGESGSDEKRQVKLNALNACFPKAEIIVIADSDDQDMLIGALLSGASGYLLRGFPSNQLPQYIQQTVRGGAAISPVMTRKLVDYFHSGSANTMDFSHQEINVLNFLCEGLTYEKISEKLGISANGVKYHIKNVYPKLKVSNKVDAVLTWRKICRKPV